MGKRKHKISDEYIRSKIRRWEKKLEDRQRVEDTDQDPCPQHVPANDPLTPPRHVGLINQQEEEYLSDHIQTEEELFENLAPNDISLPSSSRQAAITVSEQAGNTSDPSTSTVPEEILQVLGVPKNVDAELGGKIPNEIAERWGKILLDGLAKEQKDLLVKKILVPENFLLVQAPKLNPEVTAVLLDANKNRDKRLEQAQNQLGSGISGLVNLISELITCESVDKMCIIKKLSEISQILLDLHYEDTMNRRRLIVPLLDKSFWSVIQPIKRNVYLFGDKLGENVKTSKEIERTGLQIKKVNPQPPPRRPPALTGNVRGPPRPLPAPRGPPVTLQMPVTRHRYQQPPVRRTAPALRGGRGPPANRYDRRPATRH